MKLPVMGQDEPAFTLPETQAILLADHVFGVTSYYRLMATKDVRVRRVRDAWKVLVKSAQKRFDAAVEAKPREARRRATHRTRGKIK